MSQSILSQRWPWISAASLVVVAYLFVPIAFLALRRPQAVLPRPFRVRAPRLVGGCAIVLSLALLCLYLPGSPASLVWPHEWAMVLGWSLLGVILWWRRPGREARAPAGRRS